MSLFYSRHQNSSMKHLTKVTKIFNQYVLSSFDNWTDATVALIQYIINCYLM